MARSTLYSKSTQNPHSILRESMPREDLEPSKPIAETDRVRQRLTRISHHFLSDAEPEQEAQSQTTHHVILLDTQPQLPLLALAELIAHRGWNVQIAYPPGTEPATMTIQPATTIPLSNSVMLKFQTINANALIALNENSTLLLTMPASYGSLRETYLTLKQHQHQLHDCVIGVTIVDAHNQITAHNWYRALSQVSKRFLGLDIVSYTFFSNNHFAHDATTALHALASLITNDIKDRIQLQHDQYDALPI